MSTEKAERSAVGLRPRGLVLVLLLLALLASCPMASAGAATGQGESAATATQLYLGQLSDQERETSDRYSEGGYWILWWTLLWQIAVSLLLLVSGLSAWMRSRSEVLTRFKVLQTTTYACLYTVAGAALTLPWTIYHGFLREKSYGLSNQGFGEWLAEQGLGIMITFVLLAALMVPLYSILRRSDLQPWLWGSIATVALFVIVILAAPVFLLPVFNDYTPIEDETVVQEILKLSEASSMEAKVVQFDASRQSSRIGAHISGLIGTRQISISDNLLATSLPEIRAVVAHEIGHQVLHHIWEKILFFAVLITVAFALIQRATGLILRRWGNRWQIHGRSDLAGFPLLAAAFSLFFFVMSPIVNSFTRTNEAEADMFSLHAAREPDGFAEVALKLAESSKLAPSPLEEWLFWDHPSPKSRIEMAMNWKMAQR